jgi:hypothetical protein
MKNTTQKHSSWFGMVGEGEGKGKGGNTPRTTIRASFLNFPKMFENRAPMFVMDGTTEMEELL